MVCLFKHIHIDSGLSNYCTLKNTSKQTQHPFNTAAKIQLVAKARTKGPKDERVIDSDFIHVHTINTFSPAFFFMVTKNVKDKQRLPASKLADLRTCFVTVW